MLSVLLSLSLLVLVVSAEESEVKRVTSGSVIKLKNQAQGGHLHSHKVNYGSGSGQQSVTGFADGEDANDYWLIQSIDPATKSAHVHGKPIARGDTVILRHMATGGWLHSHEHKSPLSGQQEVSAFTGKDDGNFWEVLPKGGDEFLRDQPVRLRHIQQDVYLAMAPNRYGNPIPNQFEVMAQKPPGPNTLWVTTNGIYFAENE